MENIMLFSCFMSLLYLFLQSFTFLSNIKISSTHQEPLDTTNSDGSFNFSIYEPGPFEMDLVFQDIDSIENGHYKTKTIYYSSGTNDLIVTLEEQEQDKQEE